MSSLSRLVQLIKNDNPFAAPLTVNSLDFMLPQVSTASGKNTQLAIAARTGSGYHGNTIIHYNRHQLSVFGDNVSMVLTPDYTLAVIVSKLNAILSTFLTVNDLIPPDTSHITSGYVGPLTLRADPNSYEWVGEITVNLLVGSTVDSGSQAAMEAVLNLRNELLTFEALVSTPGNDTTGMIQSVKTNNTSDDFLFGQACYSIGTNDVGLSRSDNAAKRFVTGLVSDPMILSNGGSGRIQTSGILAGTMSQWNAATGMLGGLVPNQVYYLDTVPGRITPFNPSGTPDLYLTVVGIAISVLEMAINIERPITL